MHSSGPVAWPKVHIVIVNWNGATRTSECLKRLAALDYPRYAVTVVDNGSSDNSTASIRDRFPAVNVVESRANLGFSGGCNLGVATTENADAAFTFFLNNDAEIKPDGLKQLVAAAASCGADIVGCRVVSSHDGHLVFDGGHWPQYLFGNLGVRTGAHRDSTQLTDHVTGCAFMVSRELQERRLKRDGFVFDPGFFMYCEETDLCVFAQENGMRCAISRDAVCTHEVAASSGGAGSALSYYYLARNRIFLARRWLSGPMLLAFHVYYVCSRTLIVLVNALRLRSTVVRAIGCGVLDGYRSRTGQWQLHGDR